MNCIIIIIILLLRVSTLYREAQCPVCFLYLVDVAPPGTLLRYFLNDSDMSPMATVTTSITFVFTLHISCNSTVKSLNFKTMSASSVSHFYEYLLQIQCLLIDMSQFSYREF